MAWMGRNADIKDGDSVKLSFIGGSWSDSGEEDEKVKDKTCLVSQASTEICLGVDLEPDEWIKDSRCSKHMTGNQKLFSSYKAYNGGNIIFGSNFHGNIIGKGQICDNKCRVTFSKHDNEITKDGKVIGRGIRKNGLYVMKLGNKPKDQICLATIDENSTLWHRRLGHANMRLIQSLASKELVRSLPKLKFDQHFCDACKIGKQAHASHKAKNIVSMTRCSELLHMDLFGPFAVRMDDHYVIHDHNSSDLALISNLTDLDFATLDVDGQSTKVKAPPPITKKMILLMMKMTFLMIKDNEVLINSDDDEVVTIIYSRSGTEEEGEREVGMEARKACIKPKNIELKKAAENNGPHEIDFEWNDQNTFTHVDKNVAWFSNYVGELVREVPMHYPS
ncbi:retrovirus-related pol polyprotein from transposon TNT 1-94 [Tanacetum coccineum]